MSRSTALLAHGEAADVGDVRRDAGDRHIQDAETPGDSFQVPVAAE